MQTIRADPHEHREDILILVRGPLLETVAVRLRLELGLGVVVMMVLPSLLLLLPPAGAGVLILRSRSRVAGCVAPADPGAGHDAPDFHLAGP